MNSEFDIEHCEEVDCSWEVEGIVVVVVVVVVDDVDDVVVVVVVVVEKQLRQLKRTRFGRIHFRFLPETGLGRHWKLPVILSLRWFSPWLLLLLLLLLGGGGCVLVAFAVFDVCLLLFVVLLLL